MRSDIWEHWVRVQRRVSDVESRHGIVPLWRKVGRDEGVILNEDDAIAVDVGVGVGQRIERAVAERATLTERQLELAGDSRRRWSYFSLSVGVSPHR